MLPSILAKQLQGGLSDYIRAAFPMATPGFKESLPNLLATKDAVFHRPFVAVRLPFRIAQDMPVGFFKSIHPAHKPYVHQQRAFERLTGDDGRSTLIATGTGSGKTECFLYPILEYCYKHRGEKGIKALIIYPMNALATDQAKRIALGSLTPAPGGPACGARYKNSCCTGAAGFACASSWMALWRTGAKNCPAKSSSAASPRPTWPGCGPLKTW